MKRRNWKTSSLCPHLHDTVDMMAMEKESLRLLGVTTGALRYKQEYRGVKKFETTQSAVRHKQRNIASPTQVSAEKTAGHHKANQAVRLVFE